MSEEKLTPSKAWIKEYIQKGAATIVWGGTIGFLMFVAAIYIGGTSVAKEQITGAGVAVFYTSAILGLGMVLFLLSYILNLLRDIKKELIDDRKEAK